MPGDSPRHTAPRTEPPAARSYPRGGAGPRTRVAAGPARARDTGRDAPSDPGGTRHAPPRPPRRPRARRARRRAPGPRARGDRLQLLPGRPLRLVDPSGDPQVVNLQVRMAQRAPYSGLPAGAPRCLVAEAVAGVVQARAESGAPPRAVIARGARWSVGRFACTYRSAGA